jgi:hypothetical protein
MMAIEEIIDRLYGLPLAEFTRARNEQASELRKSGQRDAAERVKALRKPTVVAAAVNRLVREHRGEVERFLRAAAALRDAQFSGKGDLAAATKQEHEALESLTRSGGEAVRQTLLAAAVDDDAARQLLEARLDQELEPRGFGTLLAYARPAAAKLALVTTAPTRQAPPEAKSKRAAPGGKKPDDSAARAELLGAEAALSAAEAEEQRARRRWEQTRRELEKARAAVDTAQRDLDRLLGSSAATSRRSPASPMDSLGRNQTRRRGRS